MATEREKEREAELESAMYTNCLLLGLDPAILGMGAGGGGGSPRVGHFRHSNPRMGEQLLYFLLSALRGPVQSAKDFDKVWPIFDSAQSRDFRKIVQGIISELESQGALPRSNSRVSSLATCCGPRFVELLWQLSVHALREVHKRTFAADAASNPLPAPLTDVSYLHAAALLPVTKARIALERRRFLKNANIAVHRQTMWSNLAHEMTAEFRGLCAEEAYLQQELEKLQDMRNRAKSEGELWDDRISGSSGQNSHLVSKATRLWESLLARKSQHEVLASGPIEDLIAHREHRYRISGTSLLAAMDLSSHVPYSDVLSVRTGEMSPPIDNREQTDSPQFQGKNENLSRADDRSGRVHPTVDVAEILRRWTHALQRIHKQSLHLAKANDGEGPELLRSTSDTSASGHAESLAATLAEHRQHLVSIQGLINQLKEAVPAMQKSISELTEEVNSISSTTMDEYDARSNSPMQSQSIGRPLKQENTNDEAAEMTSKLSFVQLDKVSTSPTLKLPHLFSLTPNSSGKGMHAPKRHALTTQSNQEGLPVGKSIAQHFTKAQTDGAPQDGDGYYARNLRRSVREAALSKPSNNTEWSQDKSSDDESEHFFIPLSTDLSRKEVDAIPNRRKQRLVFSPPEIRVSRNTKDLHSNTESQLNSVPVVSDKLDGLDDYGNPTQLVQPALGNVRSTFTDIDDGLDQVFSPPLLMESSFFQDTYEDLLAPLSETDAALMEL
uniref:AUGMIN subunit 6 isoform X1 n=1 Tax=Elaeis guineensis var. tenera TaxID=51953 RepID=A0A6I9QPS7_ELAGV|nr:AUGMIN subunit 6 isoform X1 [Elaeis guineensis]